MIDPVERLVRSVDAARASGDLALVARLEEQIRQVTAGQPRKISGVAKITIPSLSSILAKSGKVEGFDEWNK